MKFSKKHLIEHNVKLRSIPQIINIVIQHMKQVRLTRLVDRPYSYVVLITHVFENVYTYKGSLNSHFLDSNLP